VIAASWLGAVVSAAALYGLELEQLRRLGHRLNVISSSLVHGRFPYRARMSLGTMFKALVAARLVACGLAMVYDCLVTPAHPRDVTSCGQRMRIRR